MNEPAAEISARWIRLWLGALIGAHAILLGWAAAGNSVTFDEYVHLPAGVAYWKYREFSVYNLSPPLLRMLGAWPAVISGVEAPDAAKFRKFPPKDRHWFYGEAFERANFESYHRLFVIGRFAMIPLSCMGAWVVFLWARQLYGSTAGLGACALYSFDPNILANASLIGTDAGTAVFILLALYLWQKFCTEPNWKRALWAALAVAGAQLCKFSALLLWPAMVILALLSLRRYRHRGRDLIAGFAISALVSLFLINLLYGYQRSFEPLGKFPFISQQMNLLRRIAPGLPAPLPRQYLLGYDAQKWEADLGRPAYLHGQTYSGGKWYYYPVALALKLPTAMLAIILLALIPNSSQRLGRAGPLLACVVVFGIGMIVLADLNVGVRYVLPILPMIFILVARVFTLSRWVRRVGWLLVLASAAESISVAPNFLSFTNFFAGKPDRAYLLMNDSNLDWGQGLLELRRWMHQHGVDRIGLAYFGRVDPDVYGINYTPLTQDGDEEYIAVSSYYLAGLTHRLPTPAGPTDLFQLSYYRALQQKTPVAVVGRTIFIFRRADVEAARRGE